MRDIEVCPDVRMFLKTGNGTAKPWLRAYRMLTQA